jgi:hypothetical protein
MTEYGRDFLMETLGTRACSERTGRGVADDRLRIRERVLEAGAESGYGVVLVQLTCQAPCQDESMIISLREVEDRWLVDYPGPALPPYSQYPDDGDGEEEATNIAQRYVEAEQDQDGAEACALLTDRWREHLEAVGNGCAWHYDVTTVEDAGVQAVFAIGDFAVARTDPTNAGSLDGFFFLIRQGDEWRVDLTNVGVP